MGKEQYDDTRYIHEEFTHKSGSKKDNMNNWVHDYYNRPTSAQKKAQIVYGLIKLCDMDKKLFRVWGGKELTIASKKFKLPTTIYDSLDSLGLITQDKNLIVTSSRQSPEIFARTLGFKIAETLDNTIIKYEKAKSTAAEAGFLKKMSFKIKDFFSDFFKREYSRSDATAEMYKDIKENSYQAFFFDKAIHTEVIGTSKSVVSEPVSMEAQQLLDSGKEFAMG